MLPLTEAEKDTLHNPILPENLFNYEFIEKYGPSEYILFIDMEQ